MLRIFLRNVRTYSYGLRNQFPPTFLLPNYRITIQKTTWTVIGLTGVIGTTVLKLVHQEAPRNGPDLAQALVQAATARLAGRDLTIQMPLATGRSVKA